MKKKINGQFFAGLFDTTKGIQSSQHSYKTSTEETAQEYSFSFNQTLIWWFYILT